MGSGVGSGVGVGVASGTALASARTSCVGAAVGAKTAFAVGSGLLHPRTTFTMTTIITINRISSTIARILRCIIRRLRRERE